MEPKRWNFVPIPSPAVSSERETVPSALVYKARDWWVQHKTALEYPQTRFERALVHLLQGWIDYSLAYECTFGDSLHYARGVVDEFSTEHDAWSRIGEGLLNLLSGEHDRLDHDTLRGAIRRLLETLEALHIPPEKGRLVPTADAILLRACTASRIYRLHSSELIDVSEAAREEIGVWGGVAVTRTLWADICTIPERLQGHTDLQSRLRDVLVGGHAAMPQDMGEPEARGYQIEMPVGETTRYDVTICRERGDYGEPVFTLKQAKEE